MKALDRITVVFFTLALIIVSLLIPAQVIASRDVYFLNQFEKLGITQGENGVTPLKFIGGNGGNSADFTYGQIKDIASHITSFMRGEKQSFELTLDGVMLNGSPTDRVEIFGEDAVTHMAVVRELFNDLKVTLALCIGIIIFCAWYMIWRKASVRKVIYRCSLATTLSVFGVLLLFFGVILIKSLLDNGLSFESFFYDLWTHMHYLFFPASQSAFNGSFFNDTLTYLLTVEFFINTAVTVVVNIIALSAAWLFSAKLISKR